MFSLFKSQKKDAAIINWVFCDFSCAFNPPLPKEYEDVFGLRWPDDFEIGKNEGNSHFQLINNFSTGWGWAGMGFFNHEGKLYHHNKTKILERTYKIRKSFIKKRYGDRRLPFMEDYVYLFETGYNSGNVEFIMFDLTNEFNSLTNSFEGFRKVLDGFPLLLFIIEVSKIENIKRMEGLDHEGIEKMENDLIIKHMEQEGWQFTERYTSPSKDKYSERGEFPLNNYSFNKKGIGDIGLEIEFF